MNIKGTKSVDHFHKQLGKIMWEKCGMARNAAGLQEAITEIIDVHHRYRNFSILTKSEAINYIEKNYP